MSLRSDEKNVEKITSKVDGKFALQRKVKVQQVVPVLSWFIRCGCYG